MKYRVCIPYAVTVTVEVEADDEQSAVDLATAKSQPRAFAGNGGMDKLIGVTGEGVSIECGEGDAECFMMPGIVVEECR